MHHLRRFLARRWMILIGLSYVAIGMLSRAYGYHQEDAVWFVHVASRILDGSFDLYSSRTQRWAAPPLIALRQTKLERPGFSYACILFAFARTLFYVCANPVSSYWRLALFAVLTGYFTARAWQLSTVGPDGTTADR